MKRNLITLAIIATLAASAYAEKPGNSGGGNGGCGVGQTTNGCGGATPIVNHGGAGGAGVGVGVGIGIAGATASSESQSDATAIAAQHQSAQAISGGNKLTNEGNNAAQSTKVIIQGDTVESNTPPVMAGVLPSVPTSCRLYLFGGGSTRDGAASGTLPIGNDQTCLSGAKLNFMQRVGGFTQAEMQAVACEVEGMEKLDTCKNLRAGN